MRGTVEWKCTQWRVRITSKRLMLKLFVEWVKLWQETLAALQIVYSDHMLESSFYKWYKLFTEWPHSGHSVEVCNATCRQKVKQALKDERRLLVRQIAFLTHVNIETIWQILTKELNMWKVCVKLVLKDLTNEQKETHIRICMEWLENCDVFDNLRWKWNFCIQSWNAMAESGVEDSRRTLNKESADVQIANESHARPLQNLTPVVPKVILYSFWLPTTEKFDSVFLTGVRLEPGIGHFEVGPKVKFQIFSLKRVFWSGTLRMWTRKFSSKIFPILQLPRPKISIRSL